MERMLGRMPEDLDKSEGSLIWEATGPAAREFELMYMALSMAIENAYPMSADREFLIRYADTYNMAPFPATKAVLRAEFTFKDEQTVNMGARFEIDGVFYSVIEHEGENLYKIECETPGRVGNRHFGQLLPVTYLRNFVSARIKSLLIPGEDEEDTETFRLRFQRSFISKRYGWNLAEYMEETCALEGVGDCKVLRCPRGKGTVDVVIIDSEYHKPTPETIDKIQKALRPLDVTGPPEIDKCGLGMVAIGHDTLVFGVKERELTVGLGLVYKDGYSWEAVKPTLTEAVKKYFLELAKDWGDLNHYTDTSYTDPTERHVEVLLSAIERIAIEVEGVKDYDRFSSTIDGKTKNVALEWDEIPVLKELTENESSAAPGPEDGSCNCPDCNMNRQCSRCERMLRSG